jgi:hypothetical protein
MLRAGLSACHGLIADCATLARDGDETPAARMLAAQTASKLAAASALTAQAIARLTEAETHQRLADAKIDVTSRHHQPNGSERRSATRNQPAYDAGDWRAYSDDDEESTNNGNAWPD